MKRTKVRITLRDGVDHAVLAAAANRISNMCGSVMSGAVKTLLSGASSAEVDRIDIKIASDTSDGLHAIFDYFNVDDALTARPLLWELLRESARN